MSNSPAPPPHQEGGFTLIELLISLALMVLLISAVAVILPRSMQLTRGDTLTAATNTTLVSIVNQLNTDLDRSRPVLLTRASRTRLDFLQLSKPYTFTTTDGQDMDGQTTLRFPDGISSNPVGGEIVFLNTAGDYLITTITKTTQLPTGEQHLTVSCPMNLPGSVHAYTFTRASYAFADSIDPSDPSILFYGTPQQSLYHSAFLTQTNGSRTPASWGELISASNVQFAPVYGQTVGDFGTTLKAPQERLKVGTQEQPMTAINYAITAVEGGHPVTNAGSPAVHLAGKQQWSCGQDIGKPLNNMGTLQVNTTLETDPHAIGSPDVTVIGPTSTISIHNFSEMVRNDMMPGTYTVHADILDLNDTSYDPHITGSPATVRAHHPGTINIDYQEATGTLQIIEDGLPPQRASQIDGTVIYKAASPNPKRSADITALTSQILPGTYVLTPSPSPITVNGQTFIATPSSVTITPRELTTVHVQWQPATGTALIHVQGLPANQPATFQFYTPSPYYLKDFNSPNGDVTIGQLQQGNYGLFAFHTPAGYVAKVTWALGSNAGTGDGDIGTGIPILPGQTTDVTVTYTLSTGNPSSGGGSGTYLVWGSVGYTVPTAIVHIRPGLEDHMNPAPAPMTAYVMDNLDAVSLPAGWYTIIVTDQKTNTLLYRTVTYLGNTPAFDLNQSGPEYGIQGAPMPSLATLYVGDNTQGNLVFYNLSDFNRPLKTRITTPNDGVVHTTLDQALLQYVGSFGVSDGGGVLWQLQNQGLSVDYENYRPIQDNINNGVQSPVTQQNFCSMQKSGPSITFQDCINAYGRFGKWW